MPIQVTEFDGVTFFEGRPRDYRDLGALSLELGGMIAQSQLKSLRDVKGAMAAEVRRRGGNAVIDFRYGQRSVSWWRSIFQMDDVNWYGEGVAAEI